MYALRAEGLLILCHLFSCCLRVSNMASDRGFEPLVMRMRQLRSSTSKPFTLSTQQVWARHRPAEVVGGVPKEPLSSPPQVVVTSHRVWWSPSPPRGRYRLRRRHVWAEGADSLLHDTLEPSSRPAESRPSQANGLCLLSPFGGGQGG